MPVALYELSKQVHDRLEGDLLRIWTGLSQSIRMGIITETRAYEDCLPDEAVVTQAVEAFTRTFS